FWNDETKCSLRNLPTSSLARALTRNASALFQVKRGSSKFPLTWRMKTSFSSFLARAAASFGESTNSTDVPHEPSASAGPATIAAPSRAPSQRQFIANLHYSSTTPQAASTLTSSDQRRGQ